MKIKNILYSIILAQWFYTTGTPTVSIDLPALLGNRLFGFCVAKILAEELNFNLHCKPIHGFPNTYSYINNFLSDSYDLEIHECQHDIDIQAIISNRNPRNIVIRGYFQRYRYLEPYAQKIRNDWLKLEANLEYKQNIHDIVLHIRFNYSSGQLPFSYYEKALSMASYNRLFICTDEPDHPELQQFNKYNPIIRSSCSLTNVMQSQTSWDDICKLNIDDFMFISSFNKIIISHSTYAWWAAFLSKATEIYAPYTRNEVFFKYGKVNEDRYRYIETNIGNIETKAITPLIANRFLTAR